MMNTDINLRDFEINPEIVFSEGHMRWSYECILGDDDFTIFGYVAVELEDEDYTSGWRIIECNGMIFDSDGKPVRSLDMWEEGFVEARLELKIDWDDLLRADRLGQEYG